MLVWWIDGSVDATVPVLYVEVDGEGDGADRVLEVWLRHGRVVNEDRRTRTELPRHATVRWSLLHTIQQRLTIATSNIIRDQSQEALSDPPEDVDQAWKVITEHR